MRPWNHSGQMLLPPIRRTPVEVAIAPACATAAACAPFTKSRRFAPSYVIARCVQVFAGRVLGPFTWRASPAA